MAAKGVSNILTILIMMLLAVTLSGMYAGWFTGIISDIQSMASDFLGNTTANLAQSVRLELASSKDGNVLIRNMGIGTLNTNVLAVFSNNQMVACPLWTVEGVYATEIQPLFIGNCTLSPRCVPGELVKITYPGGSTQKSCE